MAVALGERRQEDQRRFRQAIAKSIEDVPNRIFENRVA